MDQGEVAAKEMGRIKLEEGPGVNGASIQAPENEPSWSKVKKEEGSRSPISARDDISLRGDGEDTPSSTKAPKLTRKSSNKAPTRAAPLYDSLPNVTSKACEAFQVIPDCLYGSKNLGSTDNDSFDCDCREEWREYKILPLSNASSTSWACSSDDEPLQS